MSERVVVEVNANDEREADKDNGQRHEETSSESCERRAQQWTAKRIHAFISQKSRSRARRKWLKIRV